ncbi:MAG: hypothetical protein PHS14_10890 [Elusimicrobia bacterium]|nr:hypothetical protein [Elusimicrobiota bacterium]
MPNTRSAKTLALIGAAALALSVGLMARSSVKTPGIPAEEMRDAVAAPVSPAMLGGARVVQPNTGYFASPAGRRAEAERALMSSRMTKVSKAMQARAAKLRREAARERALAVSAQ